MVGVDGGESEDDEDGEVDGLEEAVEDDHGIPEEQEVYRYWSVVVVAKAGGRK